VANRLDGTVSRIDRDRQVVTITVDGAPSGLAFAGGSLWVADGDARSVAQVDPGADKVRQRIDVGNAPRSLAAAAGALWVVSGLDGSVNKIDLDRGQVTRSIPIGAVPTAIVAGSGALWVASEEGGTVTRIEPRTGSVVQTIPVGNGPSALAAGEGGIWVVNRHVGTLSRIDPARNTVSWVIGIGSDPTAVAVGGGTVWVAGGEEGTVARVDPDGPRVVEKLKTGSSPAALALAGGSLWTAAAAPQAAHRGGTLRVLANADERLAIDWIEEAGYTTPSTELTSLAYDGLVAYRRVSGAAGATLVGALATTVPPPSRDGRTYAFTLRPGVRYSDGTLVQPEDFRASMERFLHVSGDLFGDFYAEMVGARRCMSHTEERCDLSRGIETDRRARTITVQLTRPDGDFLHKLTMPFAYVVPANTPVRLIGNRAPPGTGPYRVATWDVKRGGTLVRNPHFKSWSPEARPAGFADRIEVSARHGEDVKGQIRDVQRGRADVTTIANPFHSLLGRERLAALAARSPGQLHSDPQPTTEWMFLNVRRRPFDAIGVRQAINFATDRARIVELEGGPEVALATCQILPPAFPGHEPYCPYTAAREAGGAWIAPDMERARRLVRQSGRAGERVVVHVPLFRRAVGRYFVGLLDDLGFRASLARVRVAGEYFPRIFDPRSRAQMGFVGWSLDYVAPSGFIDANFTCTTHADVELNASRICDRRLTRQVDRGLTAPPTESTRVWAAADRRVVDLAPAVAMTNQRAAVFVSKRVGNVQHHPQWFTLLDQMWVR
jgi:peptide/nickel transport system substrate-binding protein